MKNNNTLKLVAIAAISLITLLAGVGCTGKVVPPGKKVIIVRVDGSSEVIEEGVFKAWGRDRAYFIDGKLNTYSKDLQILCADDINMSVRVKWIGSFAADKQYVDIIKEKVPAARINDGSDVEGYELSLDKFYKIAMEDVISSITRDVVSPYVTDNIREQRGVIQSTVKEKVLERFTKLNYPISTADVMITNLDYPPEVTAMRKQIKQAELKDQENAALAKANVAKAQRDAELETERGKALLVAAQAKAAANKVLAESLTPQVLLMKQYEAMERLAEGDNNSALIMPYEAITSGWSQTQILREAVTQK